MNIISIHKFIII